MNEVTKPKLLLVNNTTNRDARPEILDRMAGNRFGIDACWAYGGEFPDSDHHYAGAYLSGSPHGSYEILPWIEREHELIDGLAERNVPMFGVCFGSQILASALCGRDEVFRRADCEVGYKWLDVRVGAAGDPVCCDLGQSVRMFVWHNDEVRDDHPDVSVLASTDMCPNQIWRHREHAAWGVQGHLEITRAEAPRWFERNRERLERDGADVDALIADADAASDAKTMLGNFLDLCWEHPARNVEIVVETSLDRGAP